MSPAASATLGGLIALGLIMLGGGAALLWQRWRRPEAVTTTRLGTPPVIDLNDLRPLRTLFVDAQGRQWVLVRSTYRRGDDGASITLDLADEAELRASRIVVDGPGHPRGARGG